MENKDIKKTGRRCVYTKLELKEHRAAYMKIKSWRCECCQQVFSLASKWNHLRTKKHKINSEREL